MFIVLIVVMVPQVYRYMSNPVILLYFASLITHKAVKK